MGIHKTRGPYFHCMKKIGMLTIGQTPRDDLIPGLLDILGPGYEIVEAGALDGHTLEDVRGIDLDPDHYILVTRMRDGTEVKGHIEYYDTHMIKVTRPEGPHFFVRKEDIRYIVESE